MAHIYGTSLFCFVLFWLASRNPAFAELLGDSCDKDKGCLSIANSTCNSTCVCMPGFVADSTKEKCLPVVKEPDSACEEKGQCSELGPLFDCVEKKCKKEGDSQEERGNKDKCTDNTCNTEEQSKPPSANGNSTTPATTSTTGAESTANNTTPEGRKATENNRSGGSSVVQISFLVVIWVIHLVM